MADLEKKEEKSRQWKSYSCSELSAFCLQVSLLLEAAVPLDEGFSIMAEDAADEKSGRCFCICQRERNWEIPALRSLKIQEFFLIT